MPGVGMGTGCLVPRWTIAGTATGQSFAQRQTGRTAGPLAADLGLQCPAVPACCRSSLGRPRAVGCRSRVTGGPPKAPTRPTCGRRGSGVGTEGQTEPGQRGVESETRPSSVSRKPKLTKTKRHLDQARCRRRNKGHIHSTPGRTRTCGPLLRRQLLYPLSYWGSCGQLIRPFYSVSCKRQIVAESAPTRCLRLHRLRAKIARDAGCLHESIPGETLGLASYQRNISERRF